MCSSFSRCLVFIKHMKVQWCSVLIVSICIIKLPFGFIRLFVWCFELYSRIFHWYHANGNQKRSGKPITICRLRSARIFLRPASDTDSMSWTLTHSNQIITLHFIAPNWTTEATIPWGIFCEAGWIVVCILVHAEHEFYKVSADFPFTTGSDGETCASHICGFICDVLASFHCYVMLPTLQWNVQHNHYDIFLVV